MRRLNRQDRIITILRVLKYWEDARRAEFAMLPGDCITITKLAQWLGIRNSTYLKRIMRQLMDYGWVYEYNYQYSKRVTSQKYRLTSKGEQVIIGLMEQLR